jgi:hypothetical protein
VGQPIGKALDLRLQRGSIPRLGGAPCFGERGAIRLLTVANPLIDASAAPPPRAHGQPGASQTYACCQRDRVRRLPCGTF